MNKAGPIIIIDDDHDDQMLLQDVFRDLNLKNEVIYFDNGYTALDYLHVTQEQPFLILSDINMPKLTGLELRENIHNHEQLRLKCIPYLFFTTSDDQPSVISAYSSSVQGFFVKPRGYEDLQRVMHNIIEYWKDCHAPAVIK